MDSLFGLAQIKREGRAYIYGNPKEDLNDLRHVVVNLRNKIADKKELMGKWPDPRGIFK